MSWQGWLLWGFVATLVLDVFLSASQAMGLTRISLPVMLGTILAFLQLSDATRNFLNSINVGGVIPGFATSDLVSLLLFCALGAVLWAVATERWLKPTQA